MSPSVVSLPNDHPSVDELERIAEVVRQGLEG